VQIFSSTISTLISYNAVSLNMQLSRDVILWWMGFTVLHSLFINKYHYSRAAHKGVNPDKCRGARAFAGPMKKIIYTSSVQHLLKFTNKYGSVESIFLIIEKLLWAELVWGAHKIYGQPWLQCMYLHFARLHSCIPIIPTILSSSRVQLLRDVGWGFTINYFLSLLILSHWHPSVLIAVIYFISNTFYCLCHLHCLLI
jgi:hypothetical protein